MKSFCKIDSLFESKYRVHKRTKTVNRNMRAMKSLCGPHFANGPFEVRKSLHWPVSAGVNLTTYCPFSSRTGRSMVRPLGVFASTRTSLPPPLLGIWKSGNGFLGADCGASNQGRSKDLKVGFCGKGLRVKPEIANVEDVKSQRGHLDLLLKKII